MSNFVGTKMITVIFSLTIISRIFLLFLFSLRIFKVPPFDNISKAPKREIPWLKGPGIIALSLSENKHSYLLMDKLFTHDLCDLENIFGSESEPEVKPLRKVLEEFILILKHSEELSLFFLPTFPKLKS